MKSVAEAIGASRYVQSHTILPELNELMIESRGLKAPYDGVTEVWWDTMSALERGMSSPAALKHKKADRGRGAIYRLQPVTGVYDRRA